MLPEDPMMLLSYVNTQLRDFYKSLDEFCNSQDVSAEELKKKLKTIDYEYDEKLNKFV
jgi:hypothetical protein